MTSAETESLLSSLDNIANELGHIARALNELNRLTHDGALHVVVDDFARDAHGSLVAAAESVPTR